jgi:hypothetical protein
MKQMTVHVGKEPDFLMKMGRIEIMHSLTVSIFANQSQNEVIKIVDRSFQKVCFDFQSLLNAKSSNQLWSMSSESHMADIFEIDSKCCRVRVKLHLPPQLPPNLKEVIKLFFLHNLSEFCKS